jgi:hypothetical protein
MQRSTFRRSSALLAALLATAACGRPRDLPAQERQVEVPHAHAHATSAMLRPAPEADPHMRLSAARPRSPADSARAARVLAEMRRELARYHDVRAAEADGFKQFLPNVTMPVYHFTNWKSAVGEAFRFDAGKPTSLLYRKNRDGSFTLLGAMYTAPRRHGEEKLDERIPLSVARWHQHVNWCTPPKGEPARWREVREGKPVFGPLSPIATEAECGAVGGEFHPHLFGWMLHVNAFASDDWKEIWGEHHDHGGGHH